MLRSTAWLSFDPFNGENSVMHLAEFDRCRSTPEIVAHLSIDTNRTRVSVHMAHDLIISNCLFCDMVTNGSASHSISCTNLSRLKSL